MMRETCPDCLSETHFCPVHQKARAEYEELNRGDVDRCRDPVYLDLLRKYNEQDEDCS